MSKIYDWLERAIIGALVLAAANVTWLVAQQESWAVVVVFWGVAAVGYIPIWLIQRWEGRKDAKALAQNETGDADSAT